MSEHFESKVRTGRGTRWNDGTMKTSLGNYIDLDGRVTTRIVNRTSMDLADRHDCDLRRGGLVSKVDTIATFVKAGMRRAKAPFV
jgi:hypothetical protein